MSSGSNSLLPNWHLVEEIVNSWTKTPSDPLLSEHTLLALRAGRGWFYADRSPVTGVVTLAPTSSKDVGLVEVASRNNDSRARLWDEGLAQLLSEADRRGFRSLEVIDRGSLLADSDATVIRSVVRLASRDLPPSSAQPGVESATVSDYDDIVGLIGRAFADHPENAWTSADFEQRTQQEWFDRSGIFTIREAGRIDGICWTKVHGDRVGEIYLIAVSPARTGVGIGTVLLRHGLHHLQSEKGCKQIIVYTEEGNEAALGLYLRAGFTMHRVDRRIGMTV